MTRAAWSLIALAAPVAWAQAVAPATPASAPTGMPPQVGAPRPVAPLPAPVISAPGIVVPPGVTPQPGFVPPAFAPAPQPLARASAPPAPPTPPAKGLPPDAPQLVVNGGTYSPRRELRMAIVNGNVVHEGTDLGSGVVVEQIQTDGLVLAYHGARYHVMY